MFPQIIKEFAKRNQDATLRSDLCTKAKIVSIQENVLQYEFFHLEGETLEEILENHWKRTGDSLDLVLAGSDIGSRSKTVIRIYDTQGKVTAWVQEYKSLRHDLTEPHNVSAQVPIWRWRERRQAKQLHTRQKAGWSRKEVLHELISTYCTQYIESLLRGNGNGIARERLDSTFRHVQRNELLELAQATKVATRLWVFVFEPNDLLADTNELITSKF